MEYKENIEVAVNDIKNCVNLSRESLKYLKNYNTSVFTQFNDYLDRISTSTSYIQTIISPTSDELSKIEYINLVELTASLSDFVNSIKTRSISEINYEPAEMSYGKFFDTKLCAHKFTKLLDSIVQKSVRSKASSISFSTAFADGHFLIRIKDNSKMKDIKNSAINNKILNMTIKDISSQMDIIVKQLNWIDGHEVQIIFNIKKRVA